MKNMDSFMDILIKRKYILYDPIYTNIKTKLF